MPLLILGLFFAIGLIIYFLLSNTTIDFDHNAEGVDEDDTDPFAQEENVIYLPADIEAVKELYKKKK